MTEDPRGEIARERIQLAKRLALTKKMIARSGGAVLRELNDRLHPRLQPRKKLGRPKEAQPMDDGAKLKAHRRKLKLSQERLAEKLGIGTATVGRLERNKPVSKEVRDKAIAFMKKTSIRNSFS
jgi:DNA-binding XRE family transcriptional regulator